MAIEKFWVNQFSGDDQLNMVVALLLVILGVGLIAHPLYLWPHYSQSAFVLNAEQTADTPEAFVQYESLPGEAQAAFLDAINDDQRVLWSGEDNQAIESFEGQPAIQYQGDYYRVQLVHRDAGGFVDVLLRWILTAGSAFLIALGGLALYAGSWRPLTPIRSLWVPVTVTAGFLATNAYDVLYSGVEGSIWGIAGLGIIELIPITALFVAVGSEVALHGRDSRLAIRGAVGILLLGAVVVGSLSVAVLIIGLYTAVGGAPWFWLGYRLTRPA